MEVIHLPLRKDEKRQYEHIVEDKGKRIRREGRGERPEGERRGGRGAGRPPRGEKKEETVAEKPVETTAWSVC